MKNKIKFLAVLALLTVGFANAQVGVGTTTPDGSAVLDVSSTTKGLLLPRLDGTQRDAMSLPATGLMIFNTSSNAVQFNSGTPASPIWTNAGGAVPYQEIRGKVKRLQAATYTLEDDVYMIETNHNAICTITFPPLTNTAADIGRTVHVFNNNTVPGSTAYVGVTAGNTVTNQFRGRFFVWTGTIWANIGL